MAKLNVRSTKKSPKQPRPKVNCPGCEYPLDRDDLEDNGLCAMCNGAEGTIW